MTPSRCRGAERSLAVTSAGPGPGTFPKQQAPNQNSLPAHPRGTCVVFIAGGGTLLTLLVPGAWTGTLPGAAPTPWSPSPHEQGEVPGSSRLCPVSSAFPLTLQCFGEQYAQPNSPKLPRVGLCWGHPSSPSPTAHPLTPCPAHTRLLCPAAAGTAPVPPSLGCPEGGHSGATGRVVTQQRSASHAAHLLAPCASCSAGTEPCQGLATASCTAPAPRQPGGQQGAGCRGRKVGRSWRPQI